MFGICVNCNSEFELTRSFRKYCSAECREQYNAKKGKRKIPQWQTKLCGMKGTSSNIGMISELLVVVDLIKRGYEPCMPWRQLAPYDILIIKDGKSIRIDVKTAHRYICRTVSPTVVANNDKYDVYAQIIHEENNIIYTPDIGELYD